MLSHVKWFSLLGVVVLAFVSLFSFGAVSAQSINDPAPGEGKVVYLYLPYSSDANDGKGYKMTRTGLLYRNDYEARGIQTAYHGVPGRANNCVDGGATFNHNNFFCFYLRDAVRTEYHDSTDGDLYQRGAIDITMPHHAEVLSASAGEVLSASNCSSDGMQGGVVDVKSGDYVVRYVHLQTANVVEGQTVKAGETLIGTVGHCGLLGGPHLHIAAFDASRSYELEIRWLDAHPMMFAEGLSIPSRRHTPGAANGSVTGEVYYIADPDKGKRESADRSKLSEEFQYGMRAKVTNSARLYTHNSSPGAINTVDLNTYQTISSQALQYGEIYRAPINWSGTYPFRSGGMNYWFYKASNGVTGWVAEGDMSGCLSAEWCDVAPTDSLYPFAVEVKSRSRGIGGFSGCDSDDSDVPWFCPNHPISRGETAKVIWETAMGRQRPANTNCTTQPFPDVPTTDTFCYYIQQLKELGVVQGKSDGLFHTGDYVTKAEFVSFVVGGMEASGFTCNYGNIVDFVREIGDVSSNSPHIQSIYCLWNALRDHQGLLRQKFGSSVTLGSNGKFNPDHSITRLQTTKLLSVAMAILSAPRQTDEQGGNDTQGSGPCWRILGVRIRGCDNVTASSVEEVTDTVVDIPMSTPSGDVDWVVLRVEDVLADVDIFVYNSELNAKITITIFNSEGNMVHLVDERNGVTQVSRQLEQGIYYIRFTNSLQHTYWGTNYTLRVSVQATELVKNVVVSATASERSDTAILAADGDVLTFWGARDFAPQWIKFDFGENTLVDKIRLLPAQNPAGRTVHNIYLYFDQQCEEEVFVQRLDLETQHNVWIEYVTPTTYAPRCIRIETVVSPTWIAWWEIEASHWRLKEPLPSPDPLPPAPDPDKIEEIFEAASIEQLFFYHSQKTVELRFRIFNRSGRTLTVPGSRPNCKIGDWKLSYEGPWNGVISQDEVISRGCMWENGEYIYGFVARDDLDLPDGDYVAKLELTHINFPSGKTPKTVVLPFTIGSQQPGAHTPDFIYQAVSIEELRASHDGINTAVTFRVYNRSDTNLILPEVNGECIVGTWASWLGDAETGYIAAGIWGQHDCLWQVDEYVEYSASTNTQFVSDTWQVYVQLHYEGIPIETQRKIASTTLTIPEPGSTSQLYLPLIMR